MREGEGGVYKANSWSTRRISPLGTLLSNSLHAYVRCVGRQQEGYPTWHSFFFACFPLVNYSRLISCLC
jgi:hypothetical protein